MKTKLTILLAAALLAGCSDPSKDKTWEKFETGGMILKDRAGSEYYVEKEFGEHYTVKLIKP